VLRIHVYPAIGDRQIRTIRREEFKELLAAMKRKGLSASRTGCAYLVISAVFNEAVRNKKLAGSPSTDIPVPGVVHAADLTGQPMGNWRRWPPGSRPTGPPLDGERHHVVDERGDQIALALEMQVEGRAAGAGPGCSGDVGGDDVGGVPGEAGDPGPVDDPGGAVPVEASPVRGEEERTVGAFADGRVDCPRGARRERDGHDLAALASDD
jgi:hypothetical protein